jgi:hypothetical protein
MACSSGIAAAITSDCSTQPIGGIETVAYLMNRKDFEPTFDGTTGSKITDVAMATGKLAYKLTVVHGSLVVGHDKVVQPGFAPSYTHYMSMKCFELTSTAIENIDNIEDLIVIVERKNKTTTGDGVFVAYGVKSGLYVTTDTRRSNAENGVRLIEMASREQEGDEYSEYHVLKTDYAGTKAALEALLTSP